jgi:hypothetical protein
MATTTTNYGFDVPTSSDLVKNGATQIALLGQDLDTFLFRPFTRNGLLNSSFNVWQRGTSFAGSNSSGTSYWADRWSMFFGTTTGFTLSRQSVNDSTNLPNIQYCARIARGSGTSGSTGGTIGQSIEILNSVPYAGKLVTLSFYARKGADYSGGGSTITATLKSGTGSSDANGIYNTYTGQANVFSSAVTLTTTWQRFTVSGTVSSTATQLALSVDSGHTGTSGTNDYYEITGIMLEVGNQASPYAPATGTIQGELAACQRYYRRISANGTNSYTGYGTAYLTSSTNVHIIIPNVTTMRTYASSVDSSTVTFQAYGGTAYSVSGITINTGVSSTDAICLDGTITGGTAGHVGQLMAYGASSGYLGWSAEL